MSANPDLTFDAAVVAFLRRAWRRALARGAEPCGYLLAPAAQPGRICAAWPGQNRHDAPARAFLLDPEEQMEVVRRARGEGLRVVGIWHGHLEGPPRPSAADTSGHGVLAPPLMLIVGRESSDEPRMRLWRRGGEASEFTEVTFRERIEQVR